MDQPDELPDLDVVTCCPSCLRVHPDRFHCPCLVERGESLAREQHEIRRQVTPRWRRPRVWDELPPGAQQDRTADAMCLVDALEAAGWRLVSTRMPGRHTMPTVLDVVR